MLGVPDQYPIDHEGVSQIMDTRVVVGTAVTPAEFCTQHGEHPIDLARAQRLTSTPAARADEERSLRGDLDESVAHATVPPQSLGRTGMQRHLARFAATPLAA